MTKPYRILFILLIFRSAFLMAQPEISMSDAILKGRSSLAPANLRALQWVPGSSTFTYVVNNKLVRTTAGSRAVDTLDILPALNEKAQAMGIEPVAQAAGLKWTDAGTLQFEAGNHLYTYQQGGDLLDRNHYPAEAENVDFHDATFNATYTINNTLWVSVDGKATQVAKSEGPGILYGKSVHREEFGIFKGTFWSPSGRYLAFYRMDESMVTQYPIYILDSMPAQVRMIRYPYAGTKSHHVTLGVFDTQTGKTLYLKTGEPAEQYLTNIAWTPDDRSILIAVLNRDQNHMWLKQYNADNGTFIKTLFEETSDKWVEPEHPAEFVPGSNTDFIWQSERDGFNHLYLYSLSGKLIRQISTGANPVTKFYGFTKDGSSCFYQVAADNAMSRYCYTAKIKGNEAPKPLSPQAGFHNILYSDNGEWILDNFTDVITPRRILLSPVKKPEDRNIIFSAPNPMGAYTPGQTNTLTLTADDGTTLNARLILPTNFDLTKKYPAIVYLYNGPHVQLVSNTWMAAGELWMHHMAQEGYAVFTIDGHGSANRGYAFESAVFRHLGDLEIADQLAGVRYLKAQSFIDSTRLGVFGWATAALCRPPL
ncbi:MAG: DPP IV N-terminal domain-containing protein [Lewinellaceae bacterium]|nr:DPP IV N-terminal domain-containing protein [Lewinellaceae bacterium]